MLRSVIIEDEADAREYLEILIGENPDVTVVGSAPDAFAGREAIERFTPDLVYLDVSLPRKDGFQLLKEIDRGKLHFHLVFTTAYEEYAIEAIREGAHDYLLKPIDRQEFTESVNRILQTNYFVLRNKQILRLSHIIYVKSVGNDLEYWMVNRDSPYRERRSLQSVSELLPSSTFHHVHRSYVINRQHVKQLNANSVLMANSKLINVSDKLGSKLAF